MKPVKIFIKGDFVDSQIYRGKLYLWHLDGKLSIYDWDMLIDKIDIKANDIATLEFSFKNGSYLYRVPKLFYDDEFKKLMLDKFKRISNQEYEINNKILDDCMIFETDCPTGILPIDTEIYNNVLYCLTENGLFSSQIDNHKSSRRKIKKEKQILDIKAFSIKANQYPQIVISAGEDGVFEYYISDDINCMNVETLKEVESSLYQVSESHSTFANYVKRSIYSTSLVEKSMFLDYEWDKSRKMYFRNPESDIDSLALFDDNDYNVSWGVDDKIYKISDNDIKLRRVSDISSGYMDVKNFKFNGNSMSNKNYGNVINASTAHFGTIIEYENALFVCSDEDIFIIRDEIVNWRVFPRSKNYQNQLHVILNDRIEIYSFSHDYFLDQMHKYLGICFREV